MSTHSCDSYELREGTLLSSISKVPSALNLRLCVIIIMGWTGPNSKPEHLSITYYNDMAPFQSISTKMKYSQNIPTPKKKKKKKLQFPSPKKHFLWQK
jgi:hypothetical protein